MTQAENITYLKDQISQAKFFLRNQAHDFPFDATISRQAELDTLEKELEDLQSQIVRPILTFTDLERVDVLMFFPVVSTFAKKLVADKGHREAYQISLRKSISLFGKVRLAGCTSHTESQYNFWSKLVEEIGDSMVRMKYSDKQYKQWMGLGRIVSDDSFEVQLKSFLVVFPQAEEFILGVK